MRAPVPKWRREFVSLSEEEGMQLNSNGYVQRSAAQWSEIIARDRHRGLGSPVMFSNCWCERITPEGQTRSD